MKRPAICLTLTEKTIQADLNLIEKFRPYIDMVELRGDFLEDDEMLNMRDFPRLAKIPSILSIRRKSDGGLYDEGEASRTILFARALSFADVENKLNNFAYVEFEDDYHIPSLQDATLAFGTKIIRSTHIQERNLPNIAKTLEKLRTSYYEIPKISFYPDSLDEITKLFDEAEHLTDYNHILVAHGPLGDTTKILSYKLKNFLTYTRADKIIGEERREHINPIILTNNFNYKNFDENTQIYGVTGWPLKDISSTDIHNNGFRNNNMNAVFIPIRSDSIDASFRFANKLNVKDMTIEVPFKEDALDCIDVKTEQVEQMEATNAVVNKDSIWTGYNTDDDGFEKAILDFTGLKSLKHKKIAIIGSTGAAKAIAYSVKKLRGHACIFAKSEGKARKIAQQYKFKSAPLNETSIPLLKKYNQIIIQTTAKGMNISGNEEENDPIYFYNFTGKEILFETIYNPPITPLMERAAEAGCNVCNGFEMLKNQGPIQFELYTGENYNGNKR